MLGLTVRGRAFIAIIAVLIGAAAWGSGRIVASVANRNQQQIKDTQQLSSTLLSEETAAATYWISYPKTEDGQRAIRVSANRYDNAFRQARRDLGTEGEMGAALAKVNALAQTWRKSSSRVTKMMNNPNPNVYPSNALLRGAQGLMTDFRKANGALQTQIWARGRHDTSLANLWSLLGAVVIAVVIAIFGELVLVRRTRREYAYREEHSDYVDALLKVKNASGAYALLTQRLEQLLKPNHVLVIPHEEPLDPGAEPLVAAERERILHFEQTHNGNVRRRRLRLGDQTLATVLIGRRLSLSDHTLATVLIERRSDLGHNTDTYVNDALAAAAPIIATLDDLADAEALATTDQLTGTANRRALEHSLKHMFAHAVRAHEPLAAIMLDLDHFKRVNDSFGHDRGDDVLRALGTVLREGVRATDVAGRYGGEEFLVLCPAADLAGGAALAMKLHAGMARLTVDDEPVTASFGVASFPESAGSPAELIKAADQALYRAKERGRNRVELAEETPVLD
jgi:diguanylate cyclase (GGDEF)-like protein